MRFALALKIGATDAVDGRRTLVPLGPARGRANEMGLAAARFADPADLDRIALLAQRRSLEIEEDVGQGALVLPGDVDEPGRTELVDQHTETVAPRSLLQRHRDGSAGAELVPVAAQ